MTSGEVKGGLPTWAKVVIALVIVFIVGAGALVIGGVVFFQQVAKQAQDPIAMRHVADAIATFPNPLPQGYKLAMGFDLAGIKTITIEHDPDKQMLIMMSFPKKDNKDAQAMVNDLFEKGVNTPQASAKFEEVKSKGTETVGGQSMPYIIGTMSDKAGNKFEGMVACIVNPSKNETIFIYGIQPPGGPYKFETTQTLLKSITKI